MLAALGIAVSPAAGAGQGYRLIEPRSADAAIPRWTPHFPEFDTVVGYSDLGHVFLRNSRSREYLVLHPYLKGGKNYGVFADLPEFEETLLKEPGFAGYVLGIDHVEAIRRLQGPLGADEVYIAKPYPFLGGSEEPETYGKGDVWVFLEIVAQAHGL